MPANEKSYENGKIYRIWSLDTDKIYIGSTCDTLSHRFCNHKSKYKYWKNGNRLFYSSFNLFEMVGIENCKIELEHNFACNNKTELNKEEGRIQRLYKDIIVNRAIAGRTQKEYEQYHKQKIKEYKQEYNKEYYQENKQEINQNQKQKHDCECGGKYTNQNKSTHFKTPKHLNHIQYIQPSNSISAHDKQ